MTGAPRRRVRLLRCMALLMVLSLVACTTATPSPTPTSTPTSAPTNTATPEPSPTPRPNRLVLCSMEPVAVSPFAPSQAGEDLLRLFYEPPAERVNYRWEPRLLERIPTPSGGEVISRTAAVPPGARYVDATNALLTNEGEETFYLPQLEVTFDLRDDLLWSDGEALTAEDALLGYHLAQEPQVRGQWRDLVERTQRFEALNALELRWTGVPGYLTADYAGFLFPPQPAHRYQGQRLDQVLQDRAPLATGPFMVRSWESGAGLLLLPNPHYAGDTPLLEEVIVRFPQVGLDGWPQLITSGECDVILPTPAMEIDWRVWAALMVQGEAVIWATTGPDPRFLRLDFNLAPRDEETSPLLDPRVRQALAHCVNRNRLIEVLPNEALLPALTFLPQRHPAFAGQDLDRIEYDPGAGEDLLEEVGWRDEDEDGIREAHDLADIDEGTPLSLTLTLAPQYTVSAANIAADLEQCGVGVVPRPVDARELYAADPGSPLFGRTFDLALFGWWSEAPQVCGAWRSDRVPQEDNDWIGENFSGYVSEAYDAACWRALNAIETETQFAALREASVLLSQDLPTLFLAWRPFWFVAHPRVQGLQPDPSNPATIWNIEEISVGE